MSKAYSVEDDVIVINRDLNELDLFVKDFLDVLSKHCDYLVVSGYVSICTGRARGTEDIDVLFPLLSEPYFSKLFNDLKVNSFWCYQGDQIKDIFPYIRDGLNIRFAKINRVLPNIELIPVIEVKKAQYFELKHPQRIRIKDFEFKIPPVEFEILYKEIRLASPKDFEDASHLRKMFSDILSEDKFKKYKSIIEENEKVV